MELVLRNKDQEISGNNVHSGANTFSGNNAFSGDNVFSGANEFSEALSSTKNIGVVGASEAVAEEFGDGVHHITKITLTDFIVGALAGAAADLCLEPITPLYTLPVGVQLRSASFASIGLTATGTAVTPEVGLGSEPGDGSANATLGAAGATFEDVLEGYDVADTETGAEVESSVATPAINESADDKTIYLNCAGTWNADNTGNLVANGEVVLVWDTIK